MSIINLTRKILPAISSSTVQNIQSINAMPEMVLSRLIRNGDKSILRVDMNQCGAAIIKSNGIKTVYTDGLCGCNSVASVIKLKNGQNLMILSHYVPTNRKGQLEALKKQLKAYELYIDKNKKPQLFFNIRGNRNIRGDLEINPNPIINEVEDLYKSFFNHGVDTSITPYVTENRNAFFSSANIFQFDPSNTPTLKITNVGEVEQYVNLAN